MGKRIYWTKVLVGTLILASAFEQQPHFGLGSRFGKTKLSLNSRGE